MGNNLALSKKSDFYVYFFIGDLEKTSELYNKHKDDIDIHENDEYLFRISCRFGRLEIAKWLWNLKKDINLHAKNDEAFKMACFNGHYEIGSWLCTLCDEYYLEITKEKIMWKCNRKKIYAENINDDVII